MKTPRPCADCGVLATKTRAPGDTEPDEFVLGGVVFCRQCEDHVSRSCEYMSKKEGVTLEEFARKRWGTKKTSAPPAEKTTTPTSDPVLVGGIPLPSFPRRSAVPGQSETA